MNLLATALISVVAVVSPVPDFRPFGTSETSTVEVDLNSIRVRTKGGIEIDSVIKLKLNKPLPVPGRKKLGAYFIDHVTAVCNDDLLRVTQSTVYAEDGEMLRPNPDAVRTMVNPHVDDNFITVYLEAMCSRTSPKPTLTT